MLRSKLVEEYWGRERGEKGLEEVGDVFAPLVRGRAEVTNREAAGMRNDHPSQGEDSERRGAQE